MATLSSSLVKKLVSVTNDSSSTATSSGTAYGTVTVSGDRTYVLIDGGTTITPVVAGADARDQDRVIVTIENHTATITSNLTNPASSYTASETEEEITEYLTTDDESGYLSLVSAYIGTLTAGYITADYISTYYLTAEEIETNYLTANEITTKYLTAEQIQADYITADEIDALYVKTTTLEADYITAGEIEAQYADIELANIDVASIASLFVNVGVLEDVTITNGYITGRLSGVTIDAGSLTSGTLDAGTIDVINLNCANLTVGTINGQQIASGTISLDNLASEVTEEIEEALTEAGLAYDEATNAYTLALGKNTVYYQDTEPSGGDYSVNDIWYDSSNDNAMYYWSGSAWVSAAFGLAALDSAISARIDQALEDAGLAYDEATNAYTIANGKNTVYYQDSEPTDGDYSENDVWYDTSNEYAMYYWNGSEWVSAALGLSAFGSSVSLYLNQALEEAGLAYDEASAAYSVASGKNSIVYQDTEPDSGYLMDTSGGYILDEDGNKIADISTYNVYDIWYDTANGFAMYYWDGDEWVSASLGYSALSSDVTGDISSALSTAGLAYDEATNAYTLAMGKNTVYYQGSEPTGDEYTVNDIWYDTANGFAMYYWNGSSWVSASFGYDALSSVISGDISEALNTAGLAYDEATNAYTVASGKNTVYYQSSEPSGSDYSVNDIWYDISNDYIMYYWDGSEWVVALLGLTALDSGIGESIDQALEEAGLAYDEATNAYTLALGKNTVYYQTSEPTGGDYTVNDLWYDTDDDNAMYYWSGTKWTAISFGYGALSSDVTGDISEALSTAGLAYDEATDAYTLALGKNAVYYKDSEPSGDDYTVNDIWYDTANGFAMYYWDGDEWVSAALGYGALSSDIAADVAEALTAAGMAYDEASNAYTVAIGKSTVYYSANEPDSGYLMDTSGDYILDEDGNKIADLGTYSENDIWYDTANGYAMYYWDGAEWIAGQYGESAISDGAITADKIAAGAVIAGKIAAGAVTADTIAANAITSDKIAANTITGDNIAANTISATNIVSGTITATQIASGTITATQIASGTITATQIASATITGDNIAANTITGSNIVAQTITAAKIASGTITATQIASATITGDNIAAGTITADNIAANTITASEIKSGTITATEIASGTITAANIASGTITATQIASGTITATQIASGTITGDSIAANTISAGNIVSGTITSTEIASGTITASNIKSGTITATQIASATITGDNIAAGTIAASNIVSGTITTTQIASGTITGDNIAASTITGSNIAAQTITAAKIASGTITATQIASETITGDNIAANTITGSNIAADTITATQIASETITASEIASGTITGSKIAAYTITGNNIVAGSIVSANIASEAITADNIASGTITGDKIAASAITADKLYIGTGGNLYINYDTFEHITDSTIYYSSSNITSATITTDTSWYGSQCLKLVGTGNAYVYLGNSANSYGCIPVTAGKIYRVSCYVKCEAESKVRIYVVSHTAINTTNSALTEITGTVGTDWTRLEGSYTAVSTYPYISIRVGVQGTVSGGITDTDGDYILDTSGDTILDISGSSSTSTSVTAYFDAIQVEIVSSEDQVAGEFTTGGTTLINGGNIITQTITATQIAANTITASQIAANTITASQIASGTITATQIASGTITATQIASGTITTDLLAANCVTTAKLKVGTGGNLYTNYDTFEQITDDTIYYAKSSNATVSITSDDAYYGDKCLQITSTGSDAYVYLGSSTNGYGCIRVLSGYIYRISCYVKSTSTTTVQLYSVGHTAKNTTNSEHTSVSKSVSTSWTRLELTYTASSTYPYLSVRVDNDTSGTTIYVDAIQIEIIDDESYETSDFSPGGTTVIDGSTIVTGTVTADKIDVTNLFAQTITFSGSIYATGTDTDGNTYEVYILPGTNSNNDFLVVHNVTDGTYPFYVRANGTAGFANWYVTSQKIYGGTSSTGVAVMQAPTSSTTYVFAAGGTSHGSYADCPFRVTKTGKLYATAAELDGGVLITGDTQITAGGLTVSGDTSTFNDDVLINGMSLTVTNGEYSNLFVGYHSTYYELVRIGGTSGAYPVDNFICYADNVYFRSNNNTKMYIGTSGANADSLTAYLNTINCYKVATFNMYTTTADSDGCYGQYTFGQASYSASIGVFGNTYFGNASANSHVYIYGGSGNYALYIGSGYLYASTTGLVATSDERLKENWRDISKYDGLFDALQAYGFTYVHGDSESYHLGFKAQDVYKALIANGMTETDFAGLITTTVSEDSPAYHGYNVEYGLDYHEFIPLLVYEVQQLKAEVAVLQAQIANYI